MTTIKIELLSVEKEYYKAVATSDVEFHVFKAKTEFGLEIELWINAAVYGDPKQPLKTIETDESKFNSSLSVDLSKPNSIPRHCIHQFVKPKSESYNTPRSTIELHIYTAKILTMLHTLGERKLKVTIFADLINHLSDAEICELLKMCPFTQEEVMPILGYNHLLHPYSEEVWEVVIKQLRDN